MSLSLSLGLSLRSHGGAATPTPPVDATVLAFYDPARGVTLVSDAVSALADQSGVGDANRNLSSAGGNLTYNVTDAAAGNRPTIQFSGANRLDTGADWSGAPYAQPITIYVVGSVANNNGRLIDGKAGARAIVMRAAAANVWSIYGGSAFVDSAAAASSMSVVCAVLNGVSSSVYVNDFTTASATGSAGTNSFSRACLGALSGGGGEAGAGSKLAMAIVCSGAHDATKRAAYRDYFTSYFGL